MGLFDIFKSKKEIKEALNDPSNPLNNQSYEPAENKSKYTETPFGNFTIEDRVFMIAKGGIVELKQAYKDLTDEGKFEVILFNSTIAMWYYSKNNPDNPINNPKYIMKIVDQARTYNIPTAENELMGFIVSRLGFYANEFNQLSEPENVPSKIFSCFYEHPLSSPEPSFDLGEIFQFKMALGIMIKWVKENTNNIG
jgi:hypothetical protein